VLRVLINNGVTGVDVLRSQEDFNTVREALANKGYGIEDRGIDQEHSTLRLRAAKYIEGRAFGCTIAYELLDSPDYRRLYQINEDLAGLREPPFLVIKQNGAEQVRHEAHTKEELLQLLVDEGRKTLRIQRYKGLGEMNPQQLWETTMDPGKRIFLQVMMEDAVAAEDTFNVLMGENVESRKEFIRTHALEVSNLDV